MVIRSFTKQDLLYCLRKEEIFRPFYYPMTPPLPTQRYLTQLYLFFALARPNKNYRKLIFYLI